MKLFHNARKLLTAVTLTFVFTIAVSLAATFYQGDLAVASPLNMFSSSHNQLTLADASLEGRMNATGKNIQGKAQEAFGNMTNNRGDQATGKAKQFEGQARNTSEDMKDMGASLQERMNATGKNIQGKVQDTIGNVKGHPQDQAAGKAKQAESNVRNAVQDMKDKT